MTQNTLIKKGLTIGIIVLFIGTTIIPLSGQTIEKSSLSTSRGHWLYVGGSGPGNYSKIQEAINASSDGDTVYVYDDSSPYYEEITIEKSIHLIGENHYTVIDGMNKIIGGVTIEADYVTVDCFTISNFYYRGIYIDNRNNVIINNIHSTHNYFYGIAIRGKNNIISNNLIENNRHGLILQDTSNNLISRNEITGCTEGFWFDLPSSHDIVINNEITKNVCGIDFDSFEHKIFSPKIKNTVVQYNNITDNSIGIKIFGKFKNGIIENNNFIKNTENIHYNIYPFPRLRIKENYWGETKNSPQVIPGHISIYLYTNTDNPKHTFNVFLNIPKVVYDWNPAQKPYDISGIQ